MRPCLDFIIFQDLKIDSSHHLKPGAPSPTLAISTPDRRTLRFSSLNVFLVWHLSSLATLSLLLVPRPYLTANYSRGRPIFATFVIFSRTGLNMVRSWCPINATDLSWAPG